MRTDGYDVCVVGAGSAGAVLAARLAEQGKRILLLEAGAEYRSEQLNKVWRSPNPAVALADPAVAGELIWPDVTSTRTQSQKQALYLRGRGVGGSSSINAQIAIRPPMEDFDEWVATGCDGWSPADVLPYFAKLENDEQFGDEAYHGRSGPTPIFRTPLPQWGAVDTALARSAQDLGIGWAPDVNAPGASGVSPYPINSRDGQRVSVNDGYLEAARERPGLTIRGNALVDSVVFDRNQAVGVRIITDGQTDIEYADTVVLSAGVVHTPAILMRSGIGPAKQLRACGIDVRSDLPVGQGMQDHPTAMVSFPLTPQAQLASPEDRHTNVCVRTSSGPGAPALDLLFASLNQNVLALATTRTGAHSGAYGVWLNQNYSRGEVILASSDPLASPIINQRMLSDPRDLPRLRHGVRTLVGMASSSHTGAITTGSLAMENEALLAALDNDRDLDSYLLATVGDAQHGTSTCRMGDPRNPATVVDPSCRVLGTQALRVIDASIFPAVTRANTNLTTIMTAELMADRMGH